MSARFISVCIFCFLCATHSPCASHAEVTHTSGRLHRSRDAEHPPLSIGGAEEPSRFSGGRKLDPDGTAAAGIVSRSVPDGPQVQERNKRDAGTGGGSPTNGNGGSLVDGDADHLRLLFSMYGDGEHMTLEGFERLVNRLKVMRDLPMEELVRDLKTDGGSGELKLNSSSNCPNRTKIVPSLSGPPDAPRIDYASFQRACPALLYDLVSPNCQAHFLIDDSPYGSGDRGVLVWVYSITAVVVISACGILALVIVPVMQKRFYKPMLQFLIALAVGTLAGDALLHLLPHAMTQQHHHHHSEGGGGDGGDNHDDNTWKGFVAMTGLAFFFIMERCILLVGKWRKGKAVKNHKHFEVLNGIDTNTNKSSEPQCMEKYNLYPHCYRDIVTDPHTTYMETDKTATTTLNDLCGSSLSKSQSNMGDDMAAVPGESNSMLPNRAVVVALREHGTEHHGHSHAHGHVYAAPGSFSSVAWMVIMGDGLHNFTDGMAIGAAFAGGPTGGLSTTVAVFCHELPHELGDFAMLLKAGMTVKQALFYNLISSVLCVLGNLVGVWLGNTESASGWVFALAAGMFIYIALVDMIPELSSAHEDEGNCRQYVLHFTGLLCGFGIMTLIAFFEHDLKTIFNQPQ